MPVNFDSLQTAYRAAPTLDPNVHVAIANTAADSGDAATAAQSTEAMGSSLTSANTLALLSDDDQKRLWSSVDDTQRQLWTAAGYQPPKHHARGGVFGMIGRNAVHGARDVIGAPNAALRQGEKLPLVGQSLGQIADLPHQSLTALTAIGTAGQHAYRASQAIEKGTAAVDAQGNITQSEGAIHNAAGQGFIDPTKGWTTDFFSPDAWSRAWGRTNKGERTFDNSQFNRIQEENQGKTLTVGNTTLPLVEVAAALASGTLNDYAKNKLKDNADALGDLEHLVPKRDAQGNFNGGDPELAKVTSDLEHHKLSFGRMVTPDSLWVDHPNIAMGLSGAGDAIFDIKSDPTLKIGKARKAMMAARHGVRTAEDVERVMATPGGQRRAQDVAGRLNKGDYAGVLNRFPSMSAALPELAEKNVRSPEELVKAMSLPTKDATVENISDWLKSNTVASRILIGDGSAAGKDAVLAPHLGVIGAKLIDSKEFLNKSIDWTQNVTLPRVGDLAKSKLVAAGAAPVNAAIQAGEKSLNILGSTFKKMSNLLPEGRDFDPNGPDALTFVQRFTRTYLDKDTSDKLVNAWAAAGHDSGIKRAVYSEMLNKVFEAGGIYKSDRGQQMAARYLSNSETAALRQKYASNNIDQVVVDGKKVAYGITEDQLTTKWSLPSYKNLASVAQRGTISKIVYGVSNNELANGFNALWKPAQLLRFGFPIRVSLDELAGAVLRNGAWNSFQSKLGYSVAKTLKEYEDDLDPETLAHVTEDGRSALSVFAGHLTKNTKLAMAHTGKQLVSKKYFDAIKWGIDNGSIDKGLPEVISARHGAVNFAHDEDTAISLLKDGVKTQKIFFRPGGEYRDYKIGNDLYDAIWKKRLESIANDDPSRFYLENFDMPHKELIDNISQKLRTTWRDTHWNKGARSQTFGENKRVGQNATEEDAARDWAEKIVANVDSLVRQPGASDNLQKSSPIAGLLEHMHQHRSAPGTDVLKLVPDEHRPPTLTGPEHVPVVAGGLGEGLKNFVEFGFDHIGKTIDWMARQPLYLHNFTAAHNELRPILESAFGKGPATEQALKELVTARAIRNTAPFIHNPEIRSQMNVLTQNLLPFQFAQEQFYKRVARTVNHSPEAIRKAQLAVNSLSASGVVHDDGSGNQVFSYPMVGHAQKSVSTLFNILGFDNKVAVHGGFSGALKMVAPGLDRTVAPSFGPLISLPVSQAARVFPELAPVEGQLLGEIGASKSFWEQIAPATIARVIHLGIDQQETSNQYRSAMNKTMQDIAASKYDPNNPKALDDWYASLEAEDGKARQELIDQLKNGTRINVAMRALLGFAAPAAPQAEIGNTDFARRIRDLQSQGLDFTTAMQQILRTNPELTPYSVFMTEGKGKEPLPSTKDSLELLDKHGDFFRNHPEAGGFFLPQGPSDSKFNSEAYRLQMAYEMRNRKSPEQFLDQLIFNEAANDYFDTRDGYMQRSANLHGPAKAQADQEWAAFKNQYYVDNPRFQYLLESSTSAPDRHATFRKLQTALEDPKAPKNSQTAAIQDVVDTYSGYLERVQSIQGRTDFAATNARKTWKKDVTDTLKSYVTDHPETKSVYNTLIKTDLEGNA